MRVRVWLFGKVNWTHSVWSTSWLAQEVQPLVVRSPLLRLRVYQPQFSALLDMGGVHGRFADLMDWIRERLSEPLGVERLADQAAMSPRHFARAFTAETGVTPAKAVERLRVEAARALLDSGPLQVEDLALEVGFGDSERMRRAFIRAFGQPPQALRRAAKGG